MLAGEDIYHECGWPTWTPFTLNVLIDTVSKKKMLFTGCGIQRDRPPAWELIFDLEVIIRIIPMHCIFSPLATGSKWGLCKCPFLSRTTLGTTIPFSAHKFCKRHCSSQRSRFWESSPLKTFKRYLESPVFSKKFRSS